MAFLRESDLMEKYNYSKSTICHMRKEMQDAGLYPQSIIGYGRGTRISEPAFLHFLQYRKLIKDPAGRKYIPTYTENFF